MAGFNWNFDATAGKNGNQFTPTMITSPDNMSKGMGGGGSGEVKYSSTVPGIVPPNTTPVTPGSSNLETQPIVGGGPFSTAMPLDPKLTGQFFNYLMSQIGKGATPFDLSANLPSGGKTNPGEMSAPNNAILQSLMRFFQGDSSAMPGGKALTDVANKGVSALPEWDAMKTAMQRQIDQGGAQVKESMAFGGNLAGTPFGSAINDYYSQSNKDLNAILAEKEFEGMGMQIQAGEFLQSQGQDFGKYLQTLDQASIDRLMNEFIRTSPEYNPLLQYMFGASTTFPPVLNKQTGQSVLGAIAPGLIGAGASATAAGAGAAGAGAGGSEILLAALAAL